MGRMRVPGELPAPLRARPFTPADARRHGVSRSRLRSADVERLERGLYRWRGPGTAASPTELDRLRRIVRRIPHTVVTGPSAARLHGWPLPRRLEQSALLTVVRPRGTRAPAAPDVCTRLTHPSRVRLLAPPALSTGAATSIVPAASARMGRGGPYGLPLLVDDHGVLEAGPLRGLRLASHADVWFHLATWLTQAELVVVADHLVRTHRKRQPILPWTTVDELRVAVERHRGEPGVVRARAALSRVRDGADSPPETELRLAFEEAGLLEPALQVEVWDPAYSYDEPATADLGFPAARIAVQYEGEHHDDPVQVRRDTRRDAAFQRQGWLVIRVAASDRAAGFRETIGLVRRALAERSPR